MRNEMSMEAISMFPILEVLKEAYVNKINNQVIENEENKNNTEDFIELYHGTTSSMLKGILTDGLVPNQNQLNTWENEVPPMKNVVYLTDVWQHFYAAVAFNKHLERIHGTREIFSKRSAIEQHVKGVKLLKGESEDFPVIVKVRVSKSDLICDEDFFLSKFMNDIVKESLEKRGIVIPEYNPYDSNSIAEAFDGKLPKDQGFIDEVGLNKENWLGQKSLEFNGTVAHKGKISPEQIVEIACYPSLQPLNWSLIDKQHDYQQNYTKWQEGFGKGDMSDEYLAQLEKYLPRMDIKIKSRFDEIENIVVNYDKKKTKVNYK